MRRTTAAAAAAAAARAQAKEEAAAARAGETMEEAEARRIKTAKRRHNENVRMHKFGWTEVPIPLELRRRGNNKNQVTHTYHHPVHGVATSKREIFKFHEAEMMDPRNPRLTFDEWRKLPSSRLLGKRAQAEAQAAAMALQGGDSTQIHPALLAPTSAEKAAAKAAGRKKQRAEKQRAADATADATAGGQQQQPASPAPLPGRVLQPLHQTPPTAPLAVEAPPPNDESAEGIAGKPPVAVVHDDADEMEDTAADVVVGGEEGDDDDDENDKESGPSFGAHGTSPAVGQDVEARYMASSLGATRCKRWYGGTVNAVHPDGTVDLVYDDGDEEWQVELKYVRPRRNGSSA
jgi:hypothetical protein